MRSLMWMPLEEQKHLLWVFDIPARRIACVVVLTNSNENYQIRKMLQIKVKDIVST